MAEQLIYESKKSKIYLLNENEWNRPVVMKILNYEFPTPSEIAQFYNEFDIIEGLNIPGIRNVLKRSKAKNRHTLYLDWFPAVTLRQAFERKPDDLLDFLYMATAAAQALGELHQHNIIHKDISPANILVNLQERAVKIIDFGISTRYNLKQNYLGNPERLEGTLAYISPEQTGRMNRTVDYRTDLYSLGVTLYEALANRLPFASTDAMELVHAHMAQIPEPVNSHNPAVPRVLANIIARLMAKNAEERYQSAFGLKHDLNICLSHLENNNICPDFELGSQDFSGKFLMAQKLYGRQREIDELMAAYQRCANGGKEIMLVSGYSGTGKSALVREIHKPITRNRGYFIEGKFDQFQRAVPYFAVVQAINELVSILLSQNEAELNTLRQSLQAALGQEGKAITDVIPQIELIIGKQPDLPEVGGAEAQNRFNYLFRKLMTALATAQHPMVLFIDDLQWADSSSLSLLKVLMTDLENKYLLCIGAYRDNEVHAAHPFMIALGEMAEEGAQINSIAIGNLSIENVSQLIGDATGIESKDTEDLTNLVYQKTSGNAFFVKEFLKSLYQDELLKFDFEALQWQWDVQKIKEKNITDNVVELMAGKVLGLSAPTQQLLKTGACIGNSFDLAMMAIIENQPEEQLVGNLKEALAEGLLVPVGEACRFSHDRIQQAVYSLIPDQQKNLAHLSIGKLLLKNIPPEKQDDRLFDITNQWNWGRELLTDEREQEQLALLNLEAGKKAKQSSAFQAALDYFQIGLSLLKTNPWQTQYTLCRNLHTEATEAAYLCGDFETMDGYYKQLLANTANLLEKVKPYEIRILAYKAENKLLDAINTGLELLKQLGENFPANPGMANVMLDLIKTKIKLSGKNNDQLSALPAMHNEEKLAAMRIMADIASSSYWATPKLFPLVIFRMVHLSLKYGNTAVSAFAFATYGVIMCGVLGQMRNGYTFGKLGLILLEKYNAKEWKTQIYTPIYALIVNWNEHVHNTLRPLQESYHIGLETGAIEFACINTNIYCIHAYLSGKRLHRLEEETQAYSNSFNQFKQETNFNYNEVYRQAMLNFLGRAANPVVLTGTAYDEEKMVKQNLERNDKTGTFFIHFNKLILNYYFHNYADAALQAAEARLLLEAVLAKFEIPNHHFYEALSLLALYPQAGSEQGKFMRRVKGNMGKLKTWAKTAPENYKHKYDLLEAECMRLAGKTNQARLVYDRAIAGASANQYLHEEALAYELTGRFYLDLKSEDLAEFYLKASYNAYREWGAEAKLRQMEQVYARYVSGAQRMGATNVLETSSNVSTTTAGYGSMLDIATLLKAANSISSEVVLEKLLNVLMQTVIENAGAQKGVLLLEEDGQLYIEAIKNMANNSISILQHVLPEACNEVAISVVSYVRRSKANLVINDAVSDSRFEKDPYALQHKAQSILCIPILQRGNFIGILYLENNLTTGAFTQERIHLISLLSGQIATSIENALLYASLGRKVDERTAELALEKQKSDDLLTNILPVEIAQELKQFGRTNPKRFESVTVLFTDFVGFTHTSSTMSPEELVSTIDQCFGAFDEIVSRHKVEKIKTIGDAYMCVGGLPIANSTHATDTLKAAIEIRDWMANFNQQRLVQQLPIFNIRIGLHTGPVVAGVVGSKKFAYDVWGDTVNTASRMESSSETGKINLSGTTYKLVSEKFHCTHRGKIAAKNKGDIDMYFAENKK
ncbi:MAG: GAF domain-containing protein [Bacteroidetes bacterium]|nr:MAG: GAF domain-containing protein [Bacteroidota bacterium]